MSNTLLTNDVTLSYGKKNILEHINLTIDKPQIISIIGPNGAGKSTLLKAFSRILAPKHGSILLDNKEIQKMPGKAVARIIAMLSQQVSIPEDLLVIDLVSLGRSPHQKRFASLTEEDRKIIRDSMKKTNITNFHHRKVSTLSGGERQRVWLAMALTQEPKILLLDEPTTFLDIHHQIEIMELVRNLHEELNITVVMVLHDLNHALRYSERIIAVKDNSIFADGNAQEVLTEEQFAKLYSVKAKKVMFKNKEEDYCVFIPYEVCK